MIINSTLYKNDSHTLCRNDIIDDLGHITRYYSVIYEKPQPQPVEVYLDVLYETIEIDDTELYKAKEFRNNKRTHRFINIDNSIKDSIYLVEFAPKQNTVFSYIGKSSDSKNNKFVWTRMVKFNKPKNLSQTPLGKKKEAKEFNIALGKRVEKVLEYTFYPKDKTI